jgi:serine/threonine-protein kinase
MTTRLSHDRWRAVSDYLDRALDATPNEVDLLLRSMRTEDATLAEDLEALLAEHNAVRRERFLDDGPLERSVVDLTGQVIGAYTLVSLLGHGGMGAVWLARRSDGLFVGQVALKLLHPGTLGHVAHERFKREGDILARLRHPHIAHLLDAGVAPDGQPYLVIEHVHGQPIDLFCDERRLTIDARVRLVLDVLAAVSHAHANLIVHRDLKPSNVLVSGDGRVTLLDFGIAKLLDPEGARTVLTRDGSHVLTPAYAAPEQLQGEPITTATDVYTVGVLLYVLLGGRHPAGSDASSPAALLEALVKHDAPRLAASLRAMSPTQAAEVAARRSTTPDRLGQALRGDLETIVAKALKKNPSERYESAAALADDLRRYLSHEPIRARPDSLRYRATKFVRRHWLPVGLAACMLVALVAGLTGTMWQARRAAQQRDVATEQLERAESINAFNSFLLSQALPGDKPLSLHEILTRAEQLVDKRFAGHESLAVELLVTIGGTYAVREQNVEARRVLKSAYERSLALSDPGVRAVAACDWARMIAADGDFAGGRRLIDAALAAMSEQPQFDTVAASCHIVKGNIAMKEGRPDIVESAARAALSRLDRRPGRSPEERSDAMQQLALARMMQGKTAEADRMFGQALEQMRAIGMQDTTGGALLYANWAQNLALTNTLQALERQGRVITIFETENPGSVPMPMRVNYGLSLNRLARYREARAVYEQVRTAARPQRNPLLVALSNEGVARACRNLNDRACAHAALKEAEETLKTFPPDHRSRTGLLREEGLLAADEGQMEEGRRLVTAALEIQQKAPLRNASHVETLLALAQLELRLGDAAQAAAHARTALERAEALRGGVPTSAWVGLSEVALGEIAEAQHDATAARPHFERALVQLIPTVGETHPATLAAKSRLAGRDSGATAR